MAGFDLKEGTYEVRNTSDDELWSAFTCVFSSKSKNTSSYKYGFLKAIIENLYNVDADLKLSFDQLFGKFTETYWNLILKYGLRQKVIINDNRETCLEQILHAAAQKYKILEPIPFESLTTEMMLDIVCKVKAKCKRYVVGALFEDTNRLFYSFSKREEWIQINPVMYEFICKHKLAIEKLNYYEWARFLERINEENVSVKLLDKIDESSKRNNLAMYRQILYEEFESKTCFYCGKKLSQDRTEVDHFIPWSFIKDDNLWNLVLACPTCNRKKNDKLPTGNYLIALENRNQKIKLETHRPEMKNYQDRMVSYVYHWAKVNGYDKIWQPEGRKELGEYDRK